MDLTAVQEIALDLSEYIGPNDDGLSKVICQRSYVTTGYGSTNANFRVRITGLTLDEVEADLEPYDPSLGENDTQPTGSPDHS